MSTDEQPMSHFVDALERELTRAGRLAESRARRRTRTRRVATAAGVATLAVVAVGVGIQVDVDHEDGSPGFVPAALGPAQAEAASRCRTPSSGPGDARSCLRALGAVAADWQAPGDGTVAYEQRWSVGVTRIVRPDGRPTAYRDAPGSYAVVFPVTTDLWIDRSGAGQTTLHPAGAPVLATARDRRRWRAAGSPKLPAPPPAGSFSASGEGITTTADGRIVERWKAGGAQEHALQVGEQGDGGATLFEGRDPTETLSRDPKQLTEEIRRLAWRQRVAISGEDCPGGFDHCSAATERNIRSNVGTLATGLLAYPATPRPLRAALLRMLAGLSGASTLGPGRDPLHRPGTIVRLPEGVNDGQELLLFDVASARLLAQGSARDASATDPLWGTLFAVREARVPQVGEVPAKR